MYFNTWNCFIASIYHAAMSDQSNVACIAASTGGKLTKKCQNIRNKNGSNRFKIYVKCHFLWLGLFVFLSNISICQIAGFRAALTYILNGPMFQGLAGEGTQHYPCFSALFWCGCHPELVIIVLGWNSLISTITDFPWYSASQRIRHHSLLFLLILTLDARWMG